MLGRGFAPGPNDLPRGNHWPTGRPPRNPVSFSVGDGFKFGCGFFLAGVLALLVGFVLIALLFVVTSLFGLNLPISR